MWGFERAGSNRAACVGDRLHRLFSTMYQFAIRSQNYQLLIALLSRVDVGADANDAHSFIRPRDPGVREEPARSRVHGDQRPLAARGRPAPAAGAGGGAQDLLERQGARIEGARRAHQAWAALSRAAHFHPYELPPTRDELVAWDEVVMEIVEATEREWR